jgi:1,2-diacylglycerol 3-alpha-glucosyltransferase
MRIAICSDQYLPMLSGIADSIEALASQLREHGHEVRIYGPDLSGSTPDANVFRFPAYVLPGGIVINLPFGAMRDMRAFKPDVVHTHLFGAAGFLAWYAARRLRIPLAGTDHTFPADYLHHVGLNFWPLPYLVRRYAAWYYQRCIFITTPSALLLDELRAYGMSRPARVVSNPITDGFRPLEGKADLKKKYGIGERAVVVFGRISSEKNLSAALDIFSDVAKRSAAELVFIGDGDSRAELEERARRAFGERVRFFGTLRGQSLIEMLNACDVFLITSLIESQSMTLLQAMACELPVVAPRAGGIPEYVEDGVNGYTVEPRELHRCADRIVQLLDDPLLAKRLGTEAARTASRFSSSAIAAQFEKIYEDAIQNRNPGA